MPFAPGHLMGDYTISMCRQLSWAVVVRCLCGHEKRWNVADLAGFRADLTMREFGLKLGPCSACGGTCGHLSLRQDVGATALHDRARFEADIAAGRKQLSGREPPEA